MGRIVHHAIIATTYDKKRAEALFKFCKGLGVSVAQVSSEVNDYQTVFIGPDGSKSGWAASDKGDEDREKVKEKLKSYAYDGGSNPFNWVEVSYSSDDLRAEVVEHGFVPYGTGGT
jgi:hypothetical protein